MQDKNGDKIYDMDDIKKMPPEEFQALMTMPNVIIKGTGVVRDKDGNIRKDDDTST